MRSGHIWVLFSEGWGLTAFALLRRYAKLEKVGEWLGYFLKGIDPDSTL